MGPVFTKVANARAHAFNAFCRKFCGGRGKVLAEIFHVYIYKKRAVVHACLPGEAESVAGKLCAGIRHKVVAPGEARMNAERAHRGKDYGKLARKVIFPAWGHKREVQVAKVVVHRAAARGAPGKAAPILCKELRAAFAPCVLVAADHNGVPVLPKVKRHALLGGIKQKLLHGKVVPWIACGAGQKSVHVESPVAASRI